VVADALQLPFAKRSFDFDFCSSMLHHFPDSGVVDMISKLRFIRPPRLAFAGSGT
jgi:hypothetical protein